MTVIDILLSHDPVIERLTKIHLQNEKVPFIETSYIKRYLDLYNPISRTWEGVYSPKWISTHYTMLELMYMEIDPKHPVYQEALATLLDKEWKEQGQYHTLRHQDMCVVGMLLGLASYGKSKDSKLHEMIDYILAHIMPDGGWNCDWERKPAPRISSVHTTLSVLEGLHHFQKAGYSYKLNEVKISMLTAIQTLLKRHLYQAHETKEPIHEAMVKPSYPPRWKYDILRALEFFVEIGYPDDLRMTDAINLVIAQMKGPFMPKGSAIPGKLHFKLEEGRYGMFNTLRALKVLKHFRRPLYEKLIKLEV